MARVINTIAITIARDSIGNVDLNKYIDRLLTASYERPGVIVETEIDVNPGDVTSYQGCIDGDMDHPEALSAELKTMAEKVLADLRAKG